MPQEMNQTLPHGEMPPMGGPGGPGGPPPMPGMEPVTLPDINFQRLTLDWAQYKNKWERHPDGYYQLKFVYYCTNVLSPAHQYMNIYVPAAYLHEDGSINHSGRCNGYDALSAPIILHNGCAGWMSSTPSGANMDYIQEGFVHVSVGARSRGLEHGIGKAPAACVDQKAAVRMLRLHDEHIPGDKEKIISCGGSGGGQMSSILGATGNMPDYYPWLEEIGAAGIRKKADGTYVSTIPDHVFASQCYCPIADINNAELAYSWMRFDSGETEVFDMMRNSKTPILPFHSALQDDLAQKFAEYINSLGLTNEAGNALRFDKKPDGSYALRSGTYHQQILDNLSNALNAWLKDKVKSDGSLEYTKSFGPGDVRHFTLPNVDAYFASLKDADKWLKKAPGGSYRVLDIAGFFRGTELARGKTIPGFDTFHCTSENNAFGQAEEDGVHFSASAAEVMEKNYDRYRELPGFEHEDVDIYIQQARREDVQRQTYLMNATHIFLGNARGAEKSDFSKYWRTRNGSADEHTSFTVAYNLCMAAKMAGADVDYALIWNAPHGDVDGDGTGSFAQWVHRISGK